MNKIKPITFGDIRFESEDAGVWVILMEREHHLISRADARKLQKYLEKYLKIKTDPPHKRMRQ